ncbi:SDR family NAD(P)-dependent oxidoreductase [Jiangella alkaliphila]|uniref:NAD(P)-dependent dehydrogenase, short-chain alcohol dehydrogenase family n=1 Tax=Jiangella alkaliphila TaxID=419479 RepID=A0A1H2JSN4_9ACTN|nr:SDR family oxidoreductase [Jiangella alkaliphila]SDU59181.1 NAD(P)-dependent dehydrogenase, short-chain alcohol dehydrogenase family [Jiangella alkaliphila]
MSRSVVVTGTGMGIGRAIADRLAADGWVVVGVERDPAADAGSCADVVTGDTAERGTHAEAARRALALAPLGGWVNNAGITEPTPLHALDEDAVRAVVAINGLGYLWGCAAAVEAFAAQGRPGAIVNIGSIHGRVSYPQHAAYEFTKGGVDALTRSVAVTYGPYGVRANAVAPGGVRTPHLQAHIAASADPAATERELAQGPPLRRIAEPGEVAAVVAFLLSDDASYVSGQSVAVDGAWTAAFSNPPDDPELRRLFATGRSDVQDEPGRG